MQLKKLCAIFSAVLVAFSCSCLPSVIDIAYADSPALTLFASGGGFNDYNRGIDIPVTDFSTFPSIPLTINISDATTLTYSINYFSFHSAPFDPAIVGGKTLYLSYYFHNGGTASVVPSDIDGWQMMNWKYSTSVTGQYDYTCRDIVNYPMQENVFVDNGSRDTPLNSCHFTIPEDACMIQSSPTRLYKYSTGTVTNASFVFPTIYLASWGSEFADKLDAILSELKIQTRDLDSILRTLNNIYGYTVDISADTSDILALFRSLIPYIVQIDTTTQDIYTILHDALASESAEMDSKSRQVAEQIMMQDNAEQYWNDKNQDNFDAIGLDSFEFGGGVVNALGTVGNLFSSIWNVLGDATIIWTFPLMLGITLVAIGRVSRSGGKGKDKGGDKE